MRKYRACGTTAMARRHKMLGEPLCEPCKEALNTYDRMRKQRRRAGIEMHKEFFDQEIELTCSYCRGKLDRRKRCAAQLGGHCTIAVGA